MSNISKGKDLAAPHQHDDHILGASSSSSTTIITPASLPVGGGGAGTPATLSRYESQKRRDWNTFCQYLKNQRPPVALTQCSSAQVLDFLRYLDQFGKTKVHLYGCVFFGQPEPPGPCTCPLKQAWGSLDALIGRLRAAYEENGGPPETNPFATGGVRVYLREVRDSQAKARGVPYKKKKKRKKRAVSSTGGGGGGGSASSAARNQRMNMGTTSSGPGAGGSEGGGGGISRFQ